MLASGATAIGSLSLVRSPAHLESFVLAFGVLTLALTLFVFDGVSLGFSVPLQSVSRLGSLPLTYDFAHFGSVSLLRSFS